MRYIIILVIILSACTQSKSKYPQEAPKPPELTHDKAPVNNHKNEKTNYDNSIKSF